jgi:hypothetical protein
MKLTFDDTFNISAYGGKLFQADPLKLDYSLDIADVETATPEGKEVQKLVNAAWSAKMAAWKKDKEKEYKDILKLTEKALLETAKKKGPEFLKAAKGDKALAANKLMQWLSEEAKGANVMIKNALSTFEGVCQKYMLELWAKVGATIDKKFKTAITKAKVKAVLKIVGLSIVIVAAAALTIAGAILAALAAPTGVGLIAGLGLAAGGIATIASAVGQIYGVVDKTWPDHKKAAKNVRDKLIVLKDALVYEEAKMDKKSDGTKLGPKEKLKLLLGNVKGKQKDVNDGLKALAMWTGKMLIDIEKSGQAELKLETKLDELDELLKKATDEKQIADIKKQQAAGVKEIFALRGARENARRYLKRYSEICDEAIKVMAEEEKLTASKLGTVVSKIEAVMASKEMETLITVGKGTVEFMKGFMKFAKM